MRICRRSAELLTRLTLMATCGLLLLCALSLTASGRVLRQSLSMIKQAPRVNYHMIRKSVEKKREEERVLFANSWNNPDADTIAMEPLLLASGMSLANAEKFFLSATADQGSFVYNSTDESLSLLKLSRLPGNAANGVLNALDFTFTSSAAVAGRLLGCSQQDITVNGIKCKPDAVIFPRKLPPGENSCSIAERIAAPRMIREVEYHHRSVSKLHSWALDLLGDHLVRAFLGFVVYNERADGTRPLLAVLYLKDAAHQVHIARLISFGTCGLHPSVVADLNGLTIPGGVIAPLTDLPRPKLAADHYYYTGMPRPAVWNGVDSTIIVPSDALLFNTGMSGGPDYVIDLWQVLADVAMVSDII